MKTLSLDVVFNSDCKLYFEAAPIGTTEENSGWYEYHKEYRVRNDDESLNAISAFRKTLRAFDKNIIDKGYNDFFHNFINKTINSDWTHSFEVKDYKGDDIEVYVKFEILDDETKKPYIFYLTEEQAEDIDWIAQGIEDSEYMSDAQIRTKVMDALISTYYKWQADEINRKDDWDD